ncbi:hypothetical protein WG909_14350 [Peptostreptococcaceae bacterium AGR-M142]
MAVYVLLLKYYEDDDKIIYKYGPNKDIMGKIEYNKTHNKLIEIEPINKDAISNKFYVNRAAQKIASITLKKNRIFPNKITIES